MIYRITHCIESNPFPVASFIGGLTAAVILSPQTIIEKALIVVAASFTTYCVMHLIDYRLPPPKFERVWHLATRLHLISMEMKNLQRGLNDEQRSKINLLFATTKAAMEDGRAERIKNDSKNVKKGVRSRNSAWF